MSKDYINAATSYLKSWLNYRLDMDDIPGMVIAIAHNGQIIYEEAFGYADMESQTEMTVGHRFHVASQSKSITAAAMMKLVEVGKIRLDDTVSRHLPWLKKHNDKRWHAVTLRQLLSHRAGVLRDGLDADYWQLDGVFPSRESLKEIILSSELVIDANVKMKYSNIGYGLLGLVIEEVTGLSYGAYIQDTIFTPLGLTSMRSDYENADINHFATGYTRLNTSRTRLPIEHVKANALAAATGLTSNARDICTFFSSLLIGKDILLSDASKREMQHAESDAFEVGDVSNERYGLGLSIIGDTIGHGGGFPGFITRTKMNTKSGFTVTILTNCLGAPVVPLVNSVLSILHYFADTKQTERFSPSFAKKIEGRYMNLWTTMDIIAWGDRILAVYPSSFQPLRYAEELEYIDDKRLTIKKAGSFASADEEVSVKYVGDEVEHMRFAGARLYPERAWMKHLEAIERIGLR